MDQSSAKWQLKIRQQYDSFCKTVLKNEMIDYEREKSYREKHEVSMTGFSEDEIERLRITDGCIEIPELFHILNFDIEIKDELLSEAIKSLPTQKREVVLMSYFLEMTDTEIAKYMDVVRLTVRYHKLTSLQMLRKIMEDIEDEKKE